MSKYAISFGALGVRNYRWYWLSLLASFAGTEADTLAKSWLIYQMTGSRLDLGIAGIALGIPILLFSLAGGIVADRIEKRDLLIVSQLVPALTALGLAVLISTGGIAWWHFVISAALQGISQAFYGPVRLSYVPELVGSGELLNANALSSAAQHGMKIVAPVLGGLLLATVGAATVYYLIFTCYAIALLVPFVLPTGLAGPGQKDPVLSDVAGGIKYIWRDPLVLSMLALFVVFTFFGMPYLYLLPSLAGDVLGVDSSGLGALVAAVGTGSLIGNLIIASAGSVKRKGTWLLIFSLIFTIALGVAAWSNVFPISSGLLVITGATSACYATLNYTLLQTHTPQQMTGRVIGIFQMTSGLMPIGALPLGVLADGVGISRAILANLSVMVLSVGWLWRWKPAFRELE